MSKGFWLMASHGRPERAIEVAAAMRAMGAEAEIIIGLNDNQDMLTAYLEAWEQHKPLNVTIRKCKGATCSADVYRDVYKLAKRRNAEWVGIMADDLWPMTPNFEAELVRTALSDGIEIASANDLWQAPKRMHGAIVFRGSFLYELGFLAPEDFRHMYVDDVWETLGKDFRNWDVRMDVITEHRHPAKNKAPRDHVYDTNDADLNAGKLVFQRWMKTERMDIVNRMGATRGIKMRPLDVAGMSITVAIPSHDHKIFLETGISLIYSILGLTQHGVGVEMAVMPGDSMVSRARNSLFSNWLRESETDYLFFVDSDMSWDPQQILRLLMDAKVGDYDVVAAIGRRKTDAEESYCYLMQPDNKGLVDPNTGCFEVRTVGAAFMLISRRIARQLVERFGEETDYIHTDGKVYWDMFANVRRETREYWSEDYMFCERVREVGGRVMVNPEIPLTHWGTKGWFGALAQSGQIVAKNLAAIEEAA